MLMVFVDRQQLVERSRARRMAFAMINQSRDQSSLTPLIFLHFKRHILQFIAIAIQFSLPVITVRSSPAS